MSANRSERGSANDARRDAEQARAFSPRYLLNTGGQAIVLCRDCRRFEFLDLQALKPDVDLRAQETRFRCRQGHSMAIVGIARGPGDEGYLPPWRLAMKRGP